MKHLSNPFDQAKISSDAYRLLVDSCTQALPNEACGILVADAEPAATPPPFPTVTAVYAIPNRSRNPRSRFDFEPAAWIEACYSMQKNRQSLVGYFHSHPSSLPLPSKADSHGLHVSSTTYWIVSLLEPNAPHVQPYWVEGGTFTPLMLTQIRV